MKLLVLSVIFSSCTSGYDILGVFPLPWGSHYILGSSLLKGLAEAGHNVTIIAPYEVQNAPSKGTWTEIVLDGFHEQYGEAFDQTTMLRTEEAAASQSSQASQFERMLDITNATFHHRKVKELIRSGTTYDAIVIDEFVNVAHHVFGHIFDGHLIVQSTIGANALVNGKVGNPYPAPTAHSLFDRFKSLYKTLLTHYFIKHHLYSLHERMVRETFPRAPPLDVLYHNVSLVLLNSHVSVNEAVPTVPNMVEIGGFHIEAKKPEKLAEDLRETLDKARENGVIYFSLGSSLRSSDLPEAKRIVLMNVFKRLKQTVLWKFEETLPGRPSNVLIRKWMPQREILAHPNVKLFITHGGLLSTMEAVYYGVPILAVPIFGDQAANAEKAIRDGIGLKVDYFSGNFTEDYLNGLLDELLNEPKYRNDAKRRAKLFHDRPTSPMETAVYWIEYVIRHGGAKHLRVAAVGMVWYKYYMVDVIGALLGVICVVSIFVWYLFECSLRKMKQRREGKLKRF